MIFKGALTGMLESHQRISSRSEMTRMAVVIGRARIPKCKMLLLGGWISPNHGYPVFVSP